METQEQLSHYERDRGKPLPSKLHSLIQARLIGRLLAYEPRLQVLSELSLELNGERFTPDVCVYTDLEFDEEEVRVSRPPVLAIEIGSPTQGTLDLVNKVKRLLNHGVQTCWLVEPQLQTLTVYTPDEGAQTYAKGVVEDVDLEVEVELSDLFATR